MIPGGNLLNMAMSVIAKQQLQYIAYAGRIVAANGDYVPSYAAPVAVLGSIQPIQRRLYEQMGLDFQKNYFNVYVPQNVVDVTRNAASDQFTYNGLTVQVESNQAWFQMDGWTQCLCVEVPNVTNYYITQNGFIYGDETATNNYITE